jgi:hypothetical protein
MTTKVALNGVKIGKAVLYVKAILLAVLLALPRKNRAGLAIEIGRRFSAACCGELQ